MSYWEVIAPVGVAALAAVVFLARRLSRHETRARHAAHDPVPGVLAGIRERYATPDIRHQLHPVAEVAGQPPWAPAPEHRGPGSLGTWFPRDQEATLRRALHLVDAYDPAEPTAAEVAASRAAHGYIPELDPDAAVREAEEAFAALMFDADPSIAPAGWRDLPREDGAGDESEGYGLTAPPAPPERPWGGPPPGTMFVLDGPWGPVAPSRLLRTTGELLRADLLAECTSFMARQDAEVAVWLAGARERWAAA